MWVNMKPYSKQLYSTVYTPYNLGITRRNDQMDQKTYLYKLKPGQHISINVVPKLVEASEEFNFLPLSIRQCKLSQETQGFTLFNEYSRKGCELECAVQKAVAFCKCLPWFYPNDFTTIPICDMYGSKCFDRITSDQYFYKKCPNWCKEECQEIVLTTLPSFFPLGILHN